MLSQETSIIHLFTALNKEELKLLHNEGIKVTYEGGLMTWQLLIGLNLAHRFYAAP